MVEICSFLIYVLVGIYLSYLIMFATIAPYYSHKMDEFEELIAIVVLATFWPIALVALMVIVLDNWLNRR